MSNHRAAFLLRGVSLLSILAASSAPAISQETVTELPPIIVYGEKFARSLQDTSSSVKVLSDEDIEEKFDAQNLKELLREIPNFHYTGTTNAPIIRGVDSQGSSYGAGAFYSGTTPRARINVDGHYLSYNEALFGGSSIWDLDHVEVFRGPQTSLQGANSIAGAVVVETKDPTFDPEAAAQAIYGSYNEKRVSGMLSGPLTNSLAARATFDYSGRDNFINYKDPEVAARGSDLDFETINGRLKLLWVPEEIPELEAKLTLSQTRTNRPTTEAADDPKESLDSYTLSLPTWEQRISTGVFDISYDILEDVTVANQFQLSVGDMDRVVAEGVEGAAIVEYRDISNETRVNFGDETSKLSGVAGVFYSHVDSDNWLSNRGITEFDDTKSSLGLFSELNWRMTDRWTLSGGLRYQRDRIERSGFATFGTLKPIDFDKSYDAWLPKVSLAYDVTEDFTVGGLISRGYNPGGVTFSFGKAEFFDYAPETTWNYEVFTRASFFENKLNINANAFYAYHKDSQRAITDYNAADVPVFVTVVNADKATSYGLELSADWQALDNLRLHGSAGLLKTEIGKFSDALGVSYKNNEFGQAPSYMFSFGADWDITGQIRLSADVHHTAESYSTDLNKEAYALDSYTIANARLSYIATDNFEVFGYVNNIFDQQAAQWKFDDRSRGRIDPTPIMGTALKPRTFGVGLKAVF